MPPYASRGTLFQAGDGAGPGVFTTRAQVRSISGPSLKNNALDVSEHDGPLPYMEFIPGLNDPGEVTIELLFDPADPTQDEGGPDGLLFTYNAAALRNYAIVWPDTAGTTWEFEAIITAYEPGAAVDDALTATLTFKLAGAPAFAT